MLEPAANAPSTFNPRQVRILKWSVAIMTALLILGIIALIYGLARQASRIAQTAPTSRIALPTATGYDVQFESQGQEIKSISAFPNLIVVHFKSAKGEEIVNIDPLSGQKYGRITIPTGGAR